MTQPFIIYALPRNRTFWLSKFLSHGATICGHEQIRHIRGLDDIKSLLDMPNHGSAETAAAPFWRLIQAVRPDIKTVVIRRPVADVVESLIATGVDFDRALLTRQMQELDAKLDQIEQRVPGAFSIAYDDLNDEATCARLYEHCTGQKHDPAHYTALAPQNLQCDLSAMMRYHHAHKPQIERVTRQAKQRMMAKIAFRPVASDGMTYQQEPFDQFLRDGQHLFAEHLIAVGEPPDNWENKNLGLMRKLESFGALYVTTARSNGKMFGYRISVIAPALDFKGLEAVQTSQYTSPNAPGCGMKIERAAIAFLRSKGATKISGRDGVRGDGGRMTPFYKRLGFEDAGRMFTLDLQEIS